MATTQPPKPARDASGPHASGENVAAADAAASRASGAGAAGKKRVRRSFQPGLSLLAEGEAMIWLTGGALALCLAMVTCLLLLVLLTGMSTFWPIPVVRLQLVDGTVHQGEVTRREHFPLTPETLEGLNAETVAAGERRLAGADRIQERRRLVRTGNFDLTGSHFHWISDFEVAEETRPEWAMVVERVEWGRFYGQPLDFTRRIPRPLDNSEQSLKSLWDFYQTNRWRLSDEQQQSLDALLPPLESRLAEMRRGNVDEFLKRFDASECDQLLVLVEGQAEPVSPQEALDQNVLEVRQVWSRTESAWQRYGEFHQESRARFRKRRSLERHEMGRANLLLETGRLALRRVELELDVVALPQANEIAQLDGTLSSLETARRETADHVQAAAGQLADQPELVELARQIAQQVNDELDQQAAEPRQRREVLMAQVEQLPPQAQTSVERFLRLQAESGDKRAVIQREIDQLNEENQLSVMRMVTAGSPDQPRQEKILALNDIVRAYPANQLTLAGKLSLYVERWLEFLTDDPREANSEGGVFPAIWGTVAMTLIMSLIVVPFGVLAALYLREYAKGGLIVSVVRIAINNLAGVPSIVFGVFGLGFFCYVLGGYVDGGPRGANLTPWPSGIWFALLTVLAIVAAAAFTFSLLSLSGHNRPSAFRRWAGRLATVLWLATTTAVVVLLATTPYFEGFFRAGLPNPTFGKGGLLWASLTLALLTLPVVIVATEEALSAVPNSLREGSYAAGASKWQTIRRIVLPHAAPGIMTGMILAMARGAGEVAPLMLVGAVKLAPELPVDGVAPFLHAQRSFMHLGFHIYDLGFQSQNSEAAKPMVFTTTLLLIALIALLNLSAVALRTRLRQRFQSSHF